jgi:hypothetical protein
MLGLPNVLDQLLETLDFDQLAWRIRCACRLDQLLQLQHNASTAAPDSGQTHATHGWRLRDFMADNNNNIIKVGTEVRVDSILF